jgi:uncharacterized protein (TIGR02266 family)
LFSGGGRPVQAMTANDKRAERRVPVALRIRLRYSDVDQFISKFAINISRGGMFLSSRNPKPIGTHLHFEMRLADDSPVIEGTGEVRWIREYDRHQPSQPHGMGIRFFELKPESQGVLERIIEHRRAVGEPDTDSIPTPRAPEPAAAAAIPAVASVITQPLPELPPLGPEPEPDPAPAAEPVQPDTGAAAAEPEPAGVDGALARARRLASSIVGDDGELERELAALLEPVEFPLESSAEAASRDLAERLGGQPVVRRAAVPAERRASNGEPSPAPPRGPSESPALPAPPPISIDDTGGSVRVDPADVLEEMDAAGEDEDVDLSDFAAENDIPTSIGEVAEAPQPVGDESATPRAGRGRGRTARG